MLYQFVLSLHNAMTLWSPTLCFLDYHNVSTKWRNSIVSDIDCTGNSHFIFVSSVSFPSEKMTVRLACSSFLFFILSLLWPVPPKSGIRHLLCALTFDLRIEAWGMMRERAGKLNSAKLSIFSFSICT
jgi:hypothetical protein